MWGGGGIAEQQLAHSLGIQDGGEPGAGTTTVRGPWLPSVCLNPKESQRARGGGRRVISGQRLLSQVSQLGARVTESDHKNCLGSERRGDAFPRRCEGRVCTRSWRSPEREMSEPERGGSHRSRSLCRGQNEQVLRARGRPWGYIPQAVGDHCLHGVP